MVADPAMALPAITRGRADAGVERGAGVDGRREIVIGSPAPPNRCRAGGSKEGPADAGSPDMETRMTAFDPPFDADLDLAFERHVDLPPETLWAAWTQPDLLMPWFCPRPWTTVACEIDLRPGGRFHTVMCSPEGVRFPNEGCYLDIVPNRRLAWTNALAPGFRPPAAPAPGDFFWFTGIVTLTPDGTGTRYGARVIHGAAADCQKHAAMGFQEGWGAALDQLIAFLKSR